MTKSANQGDAAAQREPRPFLYLEPGDPRHAQGAVDEVGAALLREALEPRIPYLVQSVVNYTIARQNARAARPQPIQMSVLNRRRRAARTWLLAVWGAQSDEAVCHKVATQYMPLLCGTGPDRSASTAPAAELMEFVRGAVTACIFDAPCDNLLPQARALAVLEGTLARHLAAVQQAANEPAPTA